MPTERGWPSCLLRLLSSGGKSLHAVLEGGAVNRLLAARPRSSDMSIDSRRRVLIARLDSPGDLLLAGPGIRGVAETGASVTLMCSRRGRPMADLLPGVTATLVFDAPWVLPDSPSVRVDDLLRVMVDVRSGSFDEAIILTSFHQSPLPLALLLRMAGVPRICAVSEDYPGGLLDVRIQLPEGLHEAQRAAAIVSAAGYPTSDAALALVADLPEQHRFAGAEEPYVVVHPGADAPARAIPADLAEEVVRRLADRGWRVARDRRPGRASTHSAGGRIRGDSTWVDAPAGASSRTSSAELRRWSWGTLARPIWPRLRQLRSSASGRP